ncbi:MAG TPA: BTAD domain-containing putative transcriptional regulator [Actinomycetota bacterium]|nr:BTAD domain-containing putative transcriptional regulator [Actinomycetota bacterium]
MDLRMLGPLEVVNAQGRVPLGGPKQRTVLALLVLRANQVVSTERLIDDVWGDTPPEAAKSSLKSYMSHLRSALGSERIEGRSGGYVLHAASDEIDAARFAALVEEGNRASADDPAAAIRAYHTALGLWRGGTLDDLSGQPSLRPEIARLEELRMAAIEQRIAAELALGRHAEVVGDLETLIGRFPLRERLWGHLMVALYRSGRQGDALAAYQRARQILSEELGIDPSTDLQRIQEQILRQDAGLELGAAPFRGYRLLDQIGEGAYGAVHRAFQPEVGREVAIKIIHPRLANHPEFIRRFSTEAQLIARLEHPHIVPLYDYWREPDGAYLVMRYLRGGSLRQALAHGPLAADRAVALVDQVALALAAAHRQGVVHRDVKPANILFDEEGNAYLSDFGIAKDLAAAGGGSSDRSAPSRFAYYISPEEARGEPPTLLGDVYSLGLVMYELLTGRHPFAETPPEELLKMHMHESVPSVRPSRPELPSSLDEVIARATAKEPTDRYPDMHALGTAFREAFPTPSEAAVAFAGEIRNPYKGLRAFLEADAPDFFGREALTDSLVEALRGGTPDARFLAVVGPSGSGKSSAVRAGLVPALRSGAVEGSDRWFIVDMLPGAHPFEELESALLRIAVASRPGLVGPLAEDDDGLPQIVEQILPTEDSELLLVIDQFEEVFSLVEDEDVRARFLRVIRGAVTDPRGRVRVLVTLRADFFDRPLLYKGFGDLLSARTHAITPLTVAELERAVSGPAERAGIRVEPQVVAEIVSEVATQPGALPLLQYALTELFDRRTESTLTAEAFHDLGGVAGALSGRAEALFDRLNRAGKDAVRQLFLRLITLSEGEAPDTRKRVPRAELMSLDLDREALESVIETFGARRLLSFDRDPGTRGPTVEMAHEAMLREWNRLREWVEDAREDLRVGRQLSASAREWGEAGRDSSFLITGPRLDQLETWSTRSGLSLTPQERDFLDASVGERARHRAEEEVRQARERALERRSFRRLRALVAVLTAAALVAGGLTAFAFNQRRRAEREARLAFARELAAAAEANLEADPELSILLSLRAVEATRSSDGSALPEAEEALHHAVVASGIALTVPGLGGAVDWSPAGTMFVTGGPEESGVIDIRDPATGKSLRAFRGHDVDVNAVAFSSDGSMLATTGDDGAAKVWDPATGKQLWSFGAPEGAGPVWGPSFSPDGSLLAATWIRQDLVRLFDLTSGRTLREIEGFGASWATSFSPDGRHLAIATLALPGAVVVEVTSGEVVFRLHAGDSPLWDIDWSPNSRWIATSSDDSTIGIWDGVSGKLQFKVFGHSGPILSADWSPDSGRLITGSSDGTARVWKVTEHGTTEVLTLSSRARGGIRGVAFSPDGQRIISGEEEISAVKVWDVGLDGNAEWSNIAADPEAFGGVAFTADGRSVVATSEGGAIGISDAESGRRISTLARDPGVAPGTVRLEKTYASYDAHGVDVSPDGRLVAAAGQKAQVWDVSTGRIVTTIPSLGGIEDVAWSPDGRLLATGSFGGVTQIVGRSGRPVATLRPEVGFQLNAVRFSPDGRLLATASYPTGRPNPSAAEVKIWDWREGEIVQRIRTWAYGLAFDPSGARIATAGGSGLTQIWDVETGREVQTLAGHSGSVFDVAFSPDGSSIATAGSDRTIRLWDPLSGVQRLVLDGHEAGVREIAFSPDGSKLASSSSDGVVRVWAVDLDDLIDIAKGKLSRGFTADECRQYLRGEICPSP